MSSAPGATDRMTFDDEFNNLSSSPDGSSGTWTTVYPFGVEAARTLPANNEAEYYWDPSVGGNPFSVSGGVLTVSATPAAPGSNPYGLPYDSGVISTHDSFAQQYGYFEMRAQLPAGAGLWPAFWMIPKNDSFSSELDVLEQLGNDPKTIYQTVHDWAGGDAATGQKISAVTDTSAGFHTYGVDWEPDTTTFYEDGKALGSVTTPASMKTPMIMMANLAVGGAGSWPGAPDGSTKFPAQMQVDYIRAYATANTVGVSGRAALADGGAAPSPAPATMAPASTSLPASTTPATPSNEATMSSATPTSVAPASTTTPPTTPPATGANPSGSAGTPGATGSTAPTPASDLSTTLPVSPLIPASPGPAPKSGTVQISLGNDTGQVVTGGEFGLATTMGTPDHGYASYADPTFQALANQYPTDLLRHNWELNTMMDIMFPTRASASTPDYSHIDTYLNQQGNLKDFFNNKTATQIVTLGFPSWLNIADPADQALFGKMVAGIAQHFIAKGEPVNNYELVNEPDGHENVTDMANTFNVVAQALKSVDPTYKLGGLTESFANPGDLKTFFQIAGPNIGFVSWHQYVTGDSTSKSSQQEVTDGMTTVQASAQTVRAEMQAAGIPDSVPMFLGEYNVDGGNYSDPNNGNMVGAVAAAATTYGIVHSNANMTMGALWDVQNDSSYSIFGSQGNYAIDSVGIVLGDLTAYMPGNLVQTTMPGDTPGLVGYTTEDNQKFSTALIDTNLSQGYTVDLSKDGLPTAGLVEVEVSPANPQGSKAAITDLSHVYVAAGSVVIISDETPHGGTELNGTTSTAPMPPPVSPSAAGTTPGNTAGSANQGVSTATGGAAGTTTSPPASSTMPANTDNSDSGGTATPPAPAASSGTTPGNTDAGRANPGGSTATPAAGTGPGDTTVPGGAAATPAPPLPSTPSPDATASANNTGANPAPGPVAAPPTVGTGPETMVLNLSEDAYRGDAQFVLTVDGKQVGPAQSVTALHGAGQSEAFTFQGNWGAGSHQFGVSFVNDLWDGSPAADRNLYIDSAAYDGVQVGNAIELRTNSTVPLGTAPIPQPASQVPGAGQGGTTATPVAGGPAAPPTVGAGPDSVTLNLSEDAYRGDAQFVLTVDGKQAGLAQSVTALHGAGQSEAFTFQGNWGTGSHQFGVSFVNDLWDGSPAADRNLYIDSATYDGGRVENPVALLTDSTAQFGSASFSEPPSQPSGPTQPTTTDPAAQPIVTSQSAAGQNNPAAGPGTPAPGSPAPPPPPQPSSGTAAPNGTQALAFGPGTQSMSFATPQNLTITGGPGADTVTATAGTNTFIAGAGSMDITGGSGASDFILHAGSGTLAIEDFLAAKGDVLTVDKALQPSFKQASDGHGGTLLTFGANQGSIDLVGVASITPSSVTFA